MDTDDIMPVDKHRRFVIFLTNGNPTGYCQERYIGGIGWILADKEEWGITPFNSLSWPAHLRPPDFEQEGA